MSMTCVRALMWLSSISISVILIAIFLYANKASLTLVCVVSKACVIASTLYLRVVISDWWVSLTNHLKTESARLEIAINPSIKPADRFSRKVDGSIVVSLPTECGVIRSVESSVIGNGGGGFSITGVNGRLGTIWSMA